MKNDKFDLPENIHQFAFIPKFDEKVDALKSLAEEEDWGYHKTDSESKHPILENYIKYTYKRLAEEKKVSYSRDEKLACLNTGLVTKNQEPIYMVLMKII